MARIVWRAGKKGQIKEVVKSDNRVEERAENKRVEGKRGVFGKEGELIKRTRIRQKEEWRKRVKMRIAEEQRKNVSLSCADELAMSMHRVLLL